MVTTPVIGVLALQGCVQPHKAHLEAAGAEFRPVKTPADFAAVDAFILPGGESTTMLKLIDIFGLEESLRRAFTAKPVWGICAGAILMAETVTRPVQKSFGLLPITICRNGYGRQNDSVQQEVAGYPVSFIRAPVIESAPASVTVRAERDGHPVWIETPQYMATTFHAELSPDAPSPMHRAFVDRVRANN